MPQINWQQFGLKKDPYDTCALVEGGELPIEQAFIGRENEKEFLNSTFDSTERLAIAICGDVGVGKTSLTNFHKFIWKYKTPKLFFSFRREIEANKELLNKRSFLIEIIGSVLREIKLLQPELLKHELLVKLNQIVDITQIINISTGASAYGFGVDFGREKIQSQPIQLSNAILEEYFVSLINFIKNNEINGLKYSGLIVHINNFDVVLSDNLGDKAVINFFNEIRDIIQIPDTYFIFLGPKDFFENIIVSQKRVKSVFIQTPLLLTPLSKTEIISAFEKRMNILKSPHIKEYIKPFDNKVLCKLYDIYNGDIRSIMSALHDILSQNTDIVAKTLSINEAMLLLGRERWHHISNIIKLKEEQKKVLFYFIESDKYLSQSDVTEKFKKPQSNISQYYFKPLKMAGIIEKKQHKNGVDYWGLSPNFEPLKFVIKFQKNINKEINIKFGQLQLFQE